VAPVPLYLAKASAALVKDGPSAALAAAQTEIAPISDVRGSAEYKRRLLRQLLVAHFQRLPA